MFKRYQTHSIIIMVDNDIFMPTIGSLVKMQVLPYRELKLTVKGDGKSEGDFVRFNDKYRLRKRRGEKKKGREQREIGLRSC